MSAQRVAFNVTGDSVEVQGALNRETVPQAWQTRSNWYGSSGNLQLNLAGLKSVDSAGLAMLIQLKAELQEQGRDSALQNTNEQLRAFAEVSGVTDLLSLG